MNVKEIEDSMMPTVECPRGHATGMFLGMRVRLRER